MPNILFFTFSFSLPWGYFGDRKGLKLVIIINLIGLAITSLAFGFSFNYTWAVVTRSLQGCFFGKEELSNFSFAS